MDLSVLGIYSTATEVGSYFQEKNDQYVACFFIGFFSSMEHGILALAKLRCSGFENV